LSRVDDTQSGRMPDRRRNERLAWLSWRAAVVGSGQIVSAREQCAGAVKERLPARYDEFVADVSEKAPGFAGWFDRWNDNQCIPVSGGTR
jgi:hypothetical protein